MDRRKTADLFDSIRRSAALPSPWRHVAPPHPFLSLFFRSLFSAFRPVRFALTSPSHGSSPSNPSVCAFAKLRTASGTSTRQGRTSASQTSALWRRAALLPATPPGLPPGFQSSEAWWSSPSSTKYHDSHGAVTRATVVQSPNTFGCRR